MLVKANHNGPAATAGSAVKGGSPAHALPTSVSVSSPLALGGPESLRGAGPLAGGAKAPDSGPRLTVGSHASNASLAGAALLSLALERPPPASPSPAHPPLSHPHHHHIVQHHPPPVSTPNSLALHPVSLGGVTTVVGPVSSGGAGPGDGRMRMIRFPPGHTPALPQSPVRQSALLMSSAANLNRPRLPQSPVPLPQTPINLVPARPQARGGTFKSAPKLIMNSNTLAAMLPKTPTPGFYPPSTSQSGASVTGILPTNPVSLIPPSAFAGSGLVGTAPRSRLPQPPSNLQPPVRMAHLQPSHPSPHPPHLKTHAHPPPQSLHSPLHQPQRHLLQRVHRRHEMDKGLDLSDKHEVLTHNAKGRRTVGFPSHHQVQMTYSPRSGRTPQATSIVGGKIMASRQLNPALQDHNYAARPPPTPPQSPTPISGNVDSPSSFSTFGIASDPNLSAPHAMVVGKSPILPPTAALDLGVAANVSPRPLSGTALEQANTVSIEEAGVGPMAPLVAAAAAVQAAAAQAASKEEGLTAPHLGVPHPLEKEAADEEDNHSGSQLSPRGGSEGEGEETETAPEGENEDDDDEDDDDVDHHNDDDEDEEAGDVVEGDNLNESLSKTSKDQDDSITRCICDFLHDDGYMICCDKCLVWQHVVCMGLDRNNIPDEYLCEICKPRPVDRKRAKTLQARRKNEIFNNSSSSEEGGSRLSLGARSALKGLRAKSKVVDKKPEIGTKVTKKKAKWTPGKGVLNPIPKADTRLVSVNKSKKQYRKRKPIDKESKKGSSGIRRLSGRRKSTSAAQPPLSILGQEDIPPAEDDDDDNNNDEEEEDEEDLLEPELEANQHLRSWIDHYEEAVTNHYSPELRARLQGAKVTSDLRSSAIGGPVKCNVSLKGNGVKILTAYANMTANTPVIECRGKLMLKSQYRSPTKSKTHPHPDSPYVFTHKLGDTLEICLDGKTYGNDSRFCRRSPNPNAQLKHVLDRGSLHIFIVSTKPIEKNQEILLPEVEHSVTNHSPSAPLPSINADLREIKKPNGSLVINEGSQSTLSGLAGNRKTLGVKPLNFSAAAGGGAAAAASASLATAGASTASSRSHTSSSLASAGISSIKKKVAHVGAASTPTPSKKNQAPSKPTLRKTSQKVSTKSPYVVHSDHSDEGLDSPSSQAEDSTNVHNGKEMKEEQEDSEKPLDELGHHRERRLSKGYDSQCSLSPSKGKPSPGKLGLPDNSGLIVGVNTINYDASSSLRNKAKSREERKMEMIMKAIEQMEKAEQRKKDLTVEEQRPLGPMKRRRSQSSKTQNNTDSALDASSADEAKSETRRVARKKARKSGSNTPQRRRSRLLSGGSQSALSETEGLSNNESTPNTAESPQGPFRFPKTKKMLMSDWQHESELAGGEDDDVSASYLKGSRSPPGIATHLLRATAPQSPNKSVCSAKKRWLRQAISEDQTEEDENNHHRRQQEQQQQQQQLPPPSPRHQSLDHSNVVSIQNGGDGESPNETVNDYVTPLKKRRLENYKNDQESPNSDQEAAETIKVEEESAHEADENLSHVMVRADSKTPPYAPSSLKKKLLNNLVLEAVLDKAMQDMLGSDTIVDHQRRDKGKEEPQEVDDPEQEEMEEAEADEQEEKNTKEDKRLAFKNEGGHFDYPRKGEFKDVPASRPEVTKVELGSESGNCAMEFSLPPCTSNTTRGESLRKSFRPSTKGSAAKCRSPSKKTKISEPEEVPPRDPIKPPSPSDEFKSFFKPNVSLEALEALEAQIEASKREREANLIESSTTYSSGSDIKAEPSEDSSRPELSSSLVVNPPGLNKSLLATNDPQRAPNEIKSEISEPNDDEVPIKPGREHGLLAKSLVSEVVATTPKRELVPEEAIVEESPSSLIRSEEEHVTVGPPKSATAMDTQEAKEHAPLPPPPSQPPQLLQTALTKPKEKRRVSLADYKRRRKIEDSSSQSSSAKVSSLSSPMAAIEAGKTASLASVVGGIGGAISCSTSSASLPYPSSVPLSMGQSGPRSSSFGDPATLGELSRLKPGPELASQEDGPGTPTLDEQSLNLNPPPTLNALPLFEKLEKLERAQKECKLKVQNALLPESIAPPPVLPAVASIPEPKRENLTERLKKEFGLMVDDESNTENEGDSTPTTEESFKNSSGVPSHDDHASMLHPGSHIPAVSRLPTNFPTNPTPYAPYPPANPYPPPPPPLPSGLSLPSPLSNVPHYPKPNTGIPPVRPYPGGPPHPPPVMKNHHGSGAPPPPPPPLPYYELRENPSPGMNVGYPSQSGGVPSSFTNYNPPHPPPPNGKEELPGRSSRRGHPSSSSTESKIDASYGCKGYYSSTRDRRDRNRDYDSRDRDYRGSPGNDRDYHHGHHHRGSGSHKSRYGSSSSSYNNRY